MEIQKKDDEWRSAFGARLLAARKAAGLSQKQVGDRLGITQSVISELEREGTGSSYTVGLALLYKVNPVWLAMGSGPMRGGVPAPDWLLELRDDELERVRQFAENLIFARSPKGKPHR